MGRKPPPADQAPILMALNLGPKSAEWLAAAGISTVGDLRRLGAVEAYVRVKRTFPSVSAVMMRALYGAIANAHWRDAPDDLIEVLLAEANAQLGPAPARAVRHSGSKSARQRSRRSALY